MTRVLGNTGNLINLVRNGGFEFAGDTGEPPDGWAVLGATQAGGIDSRFLDETAVPSSDDEPKNRVHFFLMASSPVTMSQGFDLELPLDLDFGTYSTGRTRGPARGVDRFLPEGYEISERLLLSGQREQTFSLAIAVPIGAVKVELLLVRDIGPSAGPVSGDLSFIEMDERFSSSRWKRLSAVVPKVDDAITRAIGFRLTKLEDETEVLIGNLSMAIGAYEILPYLGNPLVAAYPKGSIVMSMGTTCPVGFEEVVEGRERFPRASLIPGVLAGEFLHAHDSAGVTLPPPIELVGPPFPTAITWDPAFIPPGFVVGGDHIGYVDPDPAAIDWIGIPRQGYIATERGSAGVDDEMDGADTVEDLPHDHEVSEQANQPSGSRRFLFCKRRDVR